MIFLLSSKPLICLLTEACVFRSVLSKLCIYMYVQA